MTSWLIPCSPDIFDAEGAFQEYGHVVWHQDCYISPGDIVYIYVSAPVKAIRCKCLVEATDIPVDTGDDDGYVLDESFCSRVRRRYMDLRLVETYDNPMLAYSMLLSHGLGGPIRSQRRAPAELVEFILRETSTQNENGELNADN